MKVVFKRDPSSQAIGEPGSFVVDAVSREAVGYFRFKRITDRFGITVIGEFWDYASGLEFDVSSCAFAPAAKQAVRDIYCTPVDNRKELWGVVGDFIPAFARP